MTSYEEYEPEPPRGWSPLAVASIATLVLLLGLGGALFGIYVADQNTLAAAQPGRTELSPTPGQSPSSSPSPTPTPTATPTPTPSATPTATSFPVPPLAGLDFRDARAKLRDLKLGWNLVFEGTEGDLTVRATDPPAGAAVTKGITVQVYVKGPAPLATVPSLVGLACDKASEALTDAGLFGSYPNGRDGVVKSQNPAASDPPTVHWNGTVTVVCGI